MPYRTNILRLCYNTHLKRTAAPAKSLSDSTQLLSRVVLLSWFEQEVVSAH